MMQRPRLYTTALQQHLQQYRQMAFVSGPRQVGKTTLCRDLANVYLNYDDLDDRVTILAGPARIAQAASLEQLHTQPVIIALDEIHKFRKWKNLLKGFFDKYERQARVLVTGSSRLDIYRKGSDSLMGRFFHYRMHPFSVGEILRTEMPTENLIRSPLPIPDGEFAALWEHGGYPEPFVQRTASFTRRWSQLRKQQLVRGDLLDLAQIHELSQMELLVEILSQRSAQQLTYSSLAAETRLSVDTIRRWIELLSCLHLGFLVRPWFRDVANSLRKEPKWFLRDWSGIADEGSRAETFIACHLLKAVEGWTDLGLGTFELRYLRDKTKREVDFAIIRDGRPWCLVEARKSDTHLSPVLSHFQSRLRVPFAFQVVLDLPYINADPFADLGAAKVVPARTLLSQLL